MGKKNLPDDHALAEFARSVQGVRPLKQDKIRLVAEKPRKVRHKQFELAEEVNSFVYLADRGEPLVQAEDYLSHTHSSISKKILRKLSKGQYNVEAKLDLHGMTVDRAKLATEQFLAGCLEQGLRTVLIIHGKGRSLDHPILKNKLNAWLRSASIVLAFSTAAPHQGGLGALCVLLKKRNY